MVLLPVRQLDVLLTPTSGLFHAYQKSTHLSPPNEPRGIWYFMTSKYLPHDP